MFTNNKLDRVVLAIACAAMVAGVLGLRHRTTNERVQVASSISEDATTSSMSGYMVAVG